MTWFSRALATMVACLGLAGPAVANSPITDGDFRPYDPKRAELGQLLFYDKILSGNKNISCGTCHNHDTGTSDGLSLGMGEGGEGVGPNRRVVNASQTPDHRVPRNSPALFNLGHKSISTLFHDGRTSVSQFGVKRFNSPAGDKLPDGLQSIVAVQALFPMTSGIEMAGGPTENLIGAAAARGPEHVWPLIVDRLRMNPEYVSLFANAYDDIETAEDITIAHVANAIDDYENSEWRSFNSRVDQYLAGVTDALDPSEAAGAALFFGDAGCSNCHSGPLYTDQGFRALAVPPFGPGKEPGYDGVPRDPGRYAVTGHVDDMFRFRVPSLRNLKETGPYGHNGAYATLEAMIRHHMDPMGALSRWDRSQLILPIGVPGDADFLTWLSENEMNMYRVKYDVFVPNMRDQEIDQIVAFLEALTEPEASAGRLGKPKEVPSGLPVD